MGSDAGSHTYDGDDDGDDDDDDFQFALLCVDEVKSVCNMRLCREHLATLSLSLYLCECLCSAFSSGLSST